MKKKTHPIKSETVPKEENSHDTNDATRKIKETRIQYRTYTESIDVYKYRTKKKYRRFPGRR